MKTGKNEIWTEYQKEIADDHYYFARSCIRQNFFPAAENLYLNILGMYLAKISLTMPDKLPARELHIIQD